MRPGTNPARLRSQRIRTLVLAVGVLVLCVVAFCAASLVR